MTGLARLAWVAAACVALVGAIIVITQSTRGIGSDAIASALPPPLGDSGEPSIEAASTYPPTRNHDIAGTSEEAVDQAVIEDGCNEESELEVATERLRRAMELTLYGQLDASAFLDAALQLVQLEPSRHAIPEPHPSGAIRYRLDGTPPGMDAELWLRRTANSKFGNPVLSLVVRVASPQGPYFLEGALRDKSEAQITIWTDGAGKVKHFGVLTNLDPAQDARYPSPRWDQGTVPCGLLYSLDAQDTVNWTGSMHGIRDGTPHDDHETPLRLIGESWPRVDGLAQLNTGLLVMVDKLDH